mmetsp:Transcript_9406/g.18346  ORF Transcript_9406/g.18346 Transcript_9406/m.18346 type:complete len:96 (-) Transcript_9406:213-500(-)
MLQMDLCVSSFSQAHIAKREKRKKREKEQKKQAKRNQKKMQQMPSTSRDEAKAFAKKDVLEQHPYSALHQDPKGRECSPASVFAKSVLSWLLGNR